MYVQAMQYLFLEVLREVQDFAQTYVLLHDVTVLDPEYASSLQPEKCSSVDNSALNAVIRLNAVFCLHNEMG